MRNHGSGPNSSTEEILTGPAYPFTSRALLQDLRVQLAQELGKPMTVDVLAGLIGRARSTTHRWFDVHAPAPLAAYMCLLERLSPSRRRAFVDSHCRVYPSLEHPRLAHSPATVDRLKKLLEQRAGLVAICGGTESNRTFVTTALVNTWWLRAKRRASVAGIDLHRPVTFVPVEGVYYIDGTLGTRPVGEIVAEIMPRILTSDAPLLIFDGVWSAAPGWREDILRCARDKHVVLAERTPHDLDGVRKCGRHPVNFLTLSPSKRVPNGIRIICERGSHDKR